jgi:hypothetical protein
MGKAIHRTNIECACCGEFFWPYVRDYKNDWSFTSNWCTWCLRREHWRNDSGVCVKRMDRRMAARRRVWFPYAA